MVTKETRSLLATSMAHGIMHSYLVVLPALLPLVKEEIGDYAVLGSLVAVVFLVYGWGALPIGVVADRFSKKILISMSMILCGVASILTALSRGIPSLALSLVLLGIGASLYHPAGFSLVSLLSRRLRGRYMGIHGVGGNAGMALAYVTSSALGVFLDWRNAFLIWGFLGIATGLTLLAILAEPERLTDDKRNQGTPLQGQLKGAPKELLTRKNVGILVPLLLIIICSGALWNGVSAFLPTYINEAKQTKLLLAGSLATVSYLVGSLSQMVGGEASDKLGRGLVLLLGFGSYSLVLLVLTHPWIEHPALVAVTVSLLGFTFFITQAPLNALLGDMSSARSRGLAYGINFSVKYGIGGVAPAIAGYFATRFSMHSMFHLFAVFSALAFTASILLFYLEKPSSPLH